MSVSAPSSRLIFDLFRTSSRLPMTYHAGVWSSPMVFDVVADYHWNDAQEQQRVEREIVAFRMVNVPLLEIIFIVPVQSLYFVVSVKVHCYPPCNVCHLCILWCKVGRFDFHLFCHHLSSQIIDVRNFGSLDLKYPRVRHHRYSWQFVAWYAWFFPRLCKFTARYCCHSTTPLILVIFDI